MTFILLRVDEIPARAADAPPAAAEAATLG
jgi:hypothetical protein